jgi:hypothetical protein
MTEHFDRSFSNFLHFEWFLYECLLKLYKSSLKCKAKRTAKNDLKCYKSTTWSSSNHLGTLMTTEQHTKNFFECSRMGLCNVQWFVFLNSRPPVLWGAISFSILFQFWQFLVLFGHQKQWSASFGFSLPWALNCSAAGLVPKKRSLNENGGTMGFLVYGHSEPAPTSTPPRMNGKWSGNSFLLGSSCMAVSSVLFFYYLPTNNPQTGC